MTFDLTGVCLRPETDSFTMESMNTSKIKSMNTSKIESMNTSKVFIDSVVKLSVSGLRFRMVPFPDGSVPYALPVHTLLLIFK